MNHQNKRSGNWIAGYLKGVPLILVLVSILISVSPYLTELFQYDLSAVGQAQFWRLFTGHFTHWNFEHLFWDVLMFAVFGCWCYKENKKAYWGIVLGVPVITSIAIMCLRPEMFYYRGLSGIDTGLFAFTALIILKKARMKHDKLILALSLLMLVLVTGKTVFELITHAAIFVAPEGFIPAPMAHFIGIILAFLVYVVIGMRCWEKRRRPLLLAKLADLSFGVPLLSGKNKT